MRVRVAYDAVPNMTDYSLVRADVQRQLPLRNLHWVRRTGANRTIRTIQALNVEVKSRDAFGPAVTALPLLERPYAYVLFVVCDDNDVYRAAIRPQIKEWLDVVTQRPQHEWLIVHVTSGRNSGTKFYQRKGAVIDKIKADFNTTKRDRCIQVAQAASAEDPTAWAEFQNKLKEAIVATFDSNVSLYEEDIRRADSQRQLEGWQYLPFFRQKEALADSFEAMTLVEDALIQYDELEALFFQALKERENAGLQDMGRLAVGDDASPLLSLTKKPYKRLIQSDAISVFDFRVYLFARQAGLLFMLGRVEDVARRGGFFISTFARTLRENSNSLGKNFLESWTYSACLNIVDECQKRVDSQVIDRVTARRFVAAKAELLELARKQLDKIGIDAGHLPATHPFSMSLNETSSTQASPTLTSVDSPVQLDEVRLKFTASDGEPVWFTAGSTLLSARETRISAFSPAPITGRLSLDLSQMRFSRIIFQYSHRPVSARNLAPEPRNLPINMRQPVVYFQRDFRAVDIWVESPQRIDLQKPRTVIICIFTGRRRLNKLIVTGVCDLERTNLAFDRAESESGSNFDLAKTPTGVTFSGLVSQATVRIEVPILGLQDGMTAVATILPLQSANFAFRIKGWKTGESRELRARVKDAIEQATVGETIASTNVVEFAGSGQFGSLRVDEHLWRAELTQYFGDKATQAWTVVQKVLEILESARSDTPLSAWRHLTLPVHIPELDTLLQVRCATPTSETELGRPLSAVYQISCSSRWSKSGARSTSRTPFRFNLTARPDDWVISGTKKGLFELESGDEHTIRVTLVPLRAGTLFLPVLQLSPTDESVTHDTQYINAAASPPTRPTREMSRRSPPAASPARQRSQTESLAPAGSSAPPHSVRVRRLRAPTVAGSSPLAPIPSEQPLVDGGAWRGAAESAALGARPSAAAPERRPRRNTLTSRIFGDEQQTLGSIQPQSRARAASRASSSGGAPVQVVVVSGSGGAQAEPTNTTTTTTEADEGRKRSTSIMSRLSNTRRDDVAPLDDDDALHHDQEVQLLDVLDQSVSTTSHLANIQSAFWPASLTRRPVVQLEAAPLDEEAGEHVTVEAPPGSSNEDLLVHVDDQDDPLDTHLVNLLRKQQRKQKRKEMLRQTMRGVVAFLKTPLGICALIYMVLVVITGSALVLLLIIPMGSYARKLWVGLFTITSLLPLPWRLRDWYNIGTITYFAHATRKRRQRMHLPPLRDPNDLPEAPDAEYWVGPGGEKMVGPRPMATTIPIKSKTDKNAKQTARNGGSSSDDTFGKSQDVELKAMTGLEQVQSDLSEEEPVLSEKELARLRKAQMVGNSVFQAMLCGVMWGLNRFNRPAWTTGCLIPLAFGCMIAASVMIWQAGERTKRKAEVTRKVWLMLKKDEEELEAKRKAIIEQRHAEKEARKHHQHHHGHASVAQ
ncbi:hypothetical protein OIV83_005882 [Microbotryomycetes sp. JL201]|nr:hypothetical protein OIV83_005882 [Microbotryomycetes sp. JL201]